MDPLETRGDNRFHSKKFCSLRRPIARRTGSVLMTSQYNKWDIFFSIKHGCIKNRHLYSIHRNRLTPTCSAVPLSESSRKYFGINEIFPVPEILCHAALYSRHHQVLDTHVCKCPSRHDE